MIISRPAHQHPSTSRRRRRLLPKSILADPEDQPGSEEELGFDDWVDKKLNSAEMDKSKRKYYSKRRKRMYGTDSEDETNRRQEGNEFVELKQEIVELRTLHKREEELYFYDTFAYPWEKDKHYKMVYQLEKKYFPDQCFDKAFLDPGESKEGEKKKKNKRMDKNEEGKEKENEDKRMLFFDDDKDKETETVGSEVKIEVSEKKVEEFFKCLKKVPTDSNCDIANPEAFLSSRSKGLPPRWDSPAGTVLLVNKPKGEHFVS